MRFHGTVILQHYFGIMLIPGVNFRHFSIVMVLMDPILNTNRTQIYDDKSYLP